jgi:hypothetical protein
MRSLTVKIDKTAPTISGLPANCLLWPPNHKMVNVASVSAIDGVSGLAAFDVIGVSNEPSNGGSSDVQIDGNGFDVRNVWLRAERSGSEIGRVYTLSILASDVAGNTATAIARCTVLHDQGK